MAYDGIQNSNRVDPLTYRKIAAKVVDTVLNGRTYASRVLGRGERMSGKTYDIPVKVVDSQAGQFFTGLENLNSAASDTLITLSFAHTAFTQPVVSLMLESFANSGPEGAIDVDTYKMDEAVAEAIQKWGSAIYGTGSSNQPLGLGAIVDDGSNVATIGGQSRSTYTVLKSTVTAFGSGQLSLTNLATLEDDITAAGIESEEPNISVTTKTVWSLYEQLLQPQVRADYAAVGYGKLPLRANDIVAPGELKAAAGFTVLAYRGKPVIKDDAATSGVWFMLNERYFGWKGRTQVPPKYQGKIERSTLGAAKTMDGVGGSNDYAPASSVGWFHQPYQMLPQQAGQIGRFYCIGQVVGSQFRRQGKGTGITTV